MLAVTCAVSSFHMIASDALKARTDSSPSSRGGGGRLEKMHMMLLINNGIICEETQKHIDQQIALCETQQEYKARKENNTVTQKARSISRTLSKHSVKEESVALRGFLLPDVLSAAKEPGNSVGIVRALRHYENVLSDEPTALRKEFPLKTGGSPLIPWLVPLIRENELDLKRCAIKAANRYMLVEANLEDQIQKQEAGEISEHVIANTRTLSEQACELGYQYAVIRYYDSHTSARLHGYSSPGGWIPQTATAKVAADASIWEVILALNGYRADGSPDQTFDVYCGPCLRRVNSPHFVWNDAVRGARNRLAVADRAALLYTVARANLTAEDFHDYGGDPTKWNLVDALINSGEPLGLHTAIYLHALPAACKWNNAAVERLLVQPPSLQTLVILAAALRSVRYLNRRVDKEENSGYAYKFGNRYLDAKCQLFSHGDAPNYDEITNELAAIQDAFYDAHIAHSSNNNPITRLASDLYTKIKDNFARLSEGMYCYKF